MNDTTFEHLISDVASEAAGPSRPVNVAEIRRNATAVSPRRGLRSLFGATRFAMAVVVVALFGGILIVGTLTSQQQSEQVAPGGGPTASPHVTDVIDVGGLFAGPIVAAGDALWVAGGDDFSGNLSQGHLSRIDPESRRVTDTVAFEAEMMWMAEVDDSLLVLDFDGALWMIDLTERTTSGPIAGIELARGGVNESTIVDSTLWAQTSDGESLSLVEIDLDDLAIVNEYAWPWGLHAADWMAELDGDIWAWRNWPDESPNEMLTRFDLDAREFTYLQDISSEGRVAWTPFATEGAIWLKNRRAQEAERFDVGSLSATDTIEHDGVGDTIVADEAMWVAQGDSIHRVDLESRKVTDIIPVGPIGFPDIESYRLMHADGAIWVVSTSEGAVYRVDTETRETTHTIETGGDPGQAVAFDGAIWVPDQERGKVTRIATGGPIE